MLCGFELRVKIYKNRTAGQPFAWIRKLNDFKLKVVTSAINSTQKNYWKIYSIYIIIYTDQKLFCAFIFFFYVCPVSNIIVTLVIRHSKAQQLIIM